MEENKTLEEVCTEYKLSEDERNEIGNKINAIMLAGKKTSEQPIAIIDIAPPGSGKTGLNGYACAQFKDNNAVVINSDELKPFHPRIDELAKKYPEYYTKVTNQESNFWTDNLFDVAVASRYNVIFEGTGRNLKLLTKMMSKMHGYKIVVRGMAVNELNCLMSIIERYEGQVEQKGWGRLVMEDHFYKAYDEMLEISSEGAKVLHNRCVEIGEKFKIPIITKSTFNNKPGTVISDIIEENTIKSVVKKDISRISIVGNGIIRNFDLIKKVLTIIEKEKLEILEFNVSESKISINFKNKISDKMLDEIHKVIT